MGVENIDIDIISRQTGKNKILVRKTYFKNKKNTTDTIIELMNLKEEIIEKPLTEIRRNEKLNRPNFCTRTCVGKNNAKNYDYSFVFHLTKIVYFFLQT